MRALGLLLPCAMAATLNVPLVDIPGGSFVMGDDEELSFSWSNTPAHEVTLSAFSIAEHETTNAEYLEFLNDAFAAGAVDAHVCTAEEAFANFEEGDEVVVPTAGEYAGQFLVDLSGQPIESDPINVCWLDWDPDAQAFVLEDAAYADWPVVHVSWFGAWAFADYYGAALPTEAQWEFAARAGTDFAYPTADGSFSNATCNGNNWVRHPTPAGSYAPNAFGLFDMCGSVYEWVDDWYDEAYYAESPADDPPGATGELVDPASVDYASTDWGNTSHVSRGGAFQYEELPASSFFKTAARHSLYPWVTLTTGGSGWPCQPRRPPPPPRKAPGGPRPRSPASSWARRWRRWAAGWSSCAWWGGGGGRK